MTESFYRAFEDKFRGSRELIRSRLEVYLAFVLPIRDTLPEAFAIDLGCGRGEWLELLTSKGFNAQGVDLDDTMSSACQALDLTVHIGDALEFLQQTPDNSQAIVSGFHIAEHLPFAQLQSLVQEAHRVLIPGGLLILETPNPENFRVATLFFYNDPTHLNPLPPDLLSFLTEFTGFKRNKVLRLQEDEKLGTASFPSLDDVLSGASPDYAIVAQKEGDAATMALLDKPFDKEYGLKVSTLLERFDCLLKEQSSKIEALTALAKTNATDLKVLTTLTTTSTTEITTTKKQSDETKAPASLTDTNTTEIKMLAALAKANSAEIAALRGQTDKIEALTVLANANSAEIAALREQRDKIEALTTLVKANSAEIAALKTSTSWRVTAPLRTMSRMLHSSLRLPSWFARGTWAWVTLKPGSRPRRMARTTLLSLTLFILARARLAALTRRILPWLLPSTVEARLRSIVPPPAQPACASPPEPEISPDLSPRAHEIYVLLETALKKQRRAA